MGKALIFIASISFILSACVGGSFCAVADKLGGPHRFHGSTTNIMTEEESKQELAFNKTGAELCGWKP